MKFHAADAQHWLKQINELKHELASPSRVESSYRRRTAPTAPPHRFTDVSSFRENLEEKLKRASRRLKGVHQGMEYERGRDKLLRAQPEPKYGRVFPLVGQAACARRRCTGCCYCRGSSLPACFKVRL